MKKLIIIIFVLGFFGCKSNPVEEKTVTHKIVNFDSTFKADSLRVEKKEDSLWSFIYKNIDSLKRSNDSLKSALFLAQYKIARVGFYVDLCERKPSQQKFLLGWVKRAIQKR